MLGLQTIRIEQTLCVIGASEGCSRNRYTELLNPASPEYNRLTMNTRSTPLKLFLTILAAFLLSTTAVEAQTSRPRRVKPRTNTEKPASDPLLRPEPTQSPTARRNDSNAPLLDVQPVKPVVNTVAPADTTHAYALLEQKQFAAAAKEAKDLAANHPNDPEAWKIAGFAELNLKQYVDAANDLEKAVELQHRTKQEDANTESALGQAYVLS